MKDTIRVMQANFSTRSLNPFSTKTHFYLEICVRVDHFY
ncbi:hypothetical protein E2C01_006662 [Portunus trituberculatus]|uniref:Uncharacterized protein n=1 Tax=Portunus trituberculatus TaxID=210409 RepID=A0A5B7CYR7_PORTR|nr:hypothetical protein [Portunus trituberculatus]